MDKENTPKKKKYKYKKIRLIDEAVCITVLIISCIYVLSPLAKIYLAVFAVYTILLIAVFKLKKFYKRKYQPTVPVKVFFGVVRGIFYTAGLIMLLLPLTLKVPVRMLYPVQRSLYLMTRDDETVREVLPENLPQDTENYHIDLFPTLEKWDGNSKLSYYGSKEDIDSLIQKGDDSAPECFFLDVVRENEGEAGKYHIPEELLVHSEDDVKIVQWAEYVSGNYGFDESFIRECRVYMYSSRCIILINAQRNYVLFVV